MHFSSLLAPILIAGAQAATGPFCPPQPATPEIQSEIFSSFVQMFLVEQRFEEAFLTYMPEDYIQHNPYILSGRQAAIDAFNGGFASGMNFTIIHEGVSNGTAWVHHRFDQENLPPSANVDIFRFNGTCLQEHWDVIQRLPANATNPLAMF